jgi:hypothetical protein
LLLIAVLAAVTGCSNLPTAPSISDIQAAQTNWTAHHLTRYAYQYMTTGFTTTFDGQAVRLVVIGDTVRSAQFVATNDSVPVVPTTLRTVDSLFALALATRQAGTLVSVQFDSAFGYPARMEISGFPSGTGVVTASNIELLP